jgi:hypothetical protein
MGYLLALALQNFSISNLFSSIQDFSSSTAGIDSKIAQTEHRLGKIRLPQAVLILLKATDMLPSEEPMLRYATLKVIERLVALNYRNHALLNRAGLLQEIFDNLYSKETTLNEAEKSVMLRTLRRLLEMGASTAEARSIYSKVVKADLTIDSEILEILKSAKRAKWPEYISFDGPASLQLGEDGGKMLPCPLGFTYMVSRIIYQKSLVV